MIPSRIVKVRLLSLVQSPFAPQRCKRYASTAEESLVPDSNEKQLQYTDEKLAEICNKSRLRPEHFRIYAGQHPQIPDDQKLQYMKTLKWQRKLIGTCGFEGQYDPGICFVTKEEMEDLNEYEKVALKVPLLEIREKELAKLSRIKKERYEREVQITQALAKQEEWKKEIRARMDERNEVAEQAKAERARILEEVRRYFGYTIDPKDEKFQIMLALKEREIAKEKKQEKKKEKERQFMEKLAALEVGTTSPSSKNEDNAKSTKTAS